jgi:class 3 adenylate cyclase
MKMRWNGRLYGLGLVLALLACLTAKGQNRDFSPLYLSLHPDSVFAIEQIQPYLSVLLDLNGNHAFEDILRFDSLDQFVPLDPELSPVIEPQAAWWLKLNLTNPGDRWHQFWLDPGRNMELWDSVSVYSLAANGQVEAQHTGRTRASAEWKLPHHPNAFPIIMPPGDSLTLYLRLRSGQKRFIPSGLYLGQVDYQDAILFSTDNRFWQGLFQGILGIQFLFFLLFFFVTRTPTYGWYVVYILGINLFAFVINQENAMLRLGLTIRIGLLIVGISLTGLGLLAFSKAYLNLDQYLPRWQKHIRRFYVLLVSCTVVLILGTFSLSEIEGSSLQLNSQNPMLNLGLAVFALAYLVQLASVPILLLIWGIRVWRKGYTAAKLYLLASIFLIISFLFMFFLWPFEEAMAGWLGWEEIPFGIFVQAGIILQLCLFGLALGYKRNLLQKEKAQALEDKIAMQKRINIATDRFVPYEFLRTMGRDSILDVKLGDQVEGKFTVFFSDIRGYTSLSEQMSPQDNFTFLNTYLGRVGPIIENRQGFVNQFLGDGIMALFMGEKDAMSGRQSLKASIEIQKAVRQFNRESTLLPSPLKIGIGLHLGPLMLGVIGDQKRMDVGVVSDTVNTASRMEGLTKWYGASIIASQTVIEQLEENADIHYRCLGKIQVKGRSQPIEVYDCFDGDEPAIASLKFENQELFRSGLAAYFRKDFADAVKIFEAVLQQFPGDQASRFYLNRSEICLREGVPEDWTGVAFMDQK